MCPLILARLLLLRPFQWLRLRLMVTHSHSHGGGAGGPSYLKSQVLKYGNTWLQQIVSLTLEVLAAAQPAWQRSGDGGRRLE